MIILRGSKETIWHDPTLIHVKALWAARSAADILNSVLTARKRVTAEKLQSTPCIMVKNMEGMSSPLQTGNKARTPALTTPFQRQTGSPNKRDQWRKKLGKKKLGCSSLMTWFFMQEKKIPNKWAKKHPEQAWGYLKKKREKETELKVTLSWCK